MLGLKAGNNEVSDNNIMEQFILMTGRLGTSNLMLSFKIGRSSRRSPKQIVVSLYQCQCSVKGEWRVHVVSIDFLRG